MTPALPRTVAGGVVGLPGFDRAAATEITSAPAAAIAEISFVRFVTRRRP